MGDQEGIRLLLPQEQPVKAGVERVQITIVHHADGVQKIGLNRGHDKPIPDFRELRDEPN